MKRKKKEEQRYKITSNNFRFLETMKTKGFECLGLILNIFGWKKFRFNFLTIEIDKEGKIIETHKYLVVRYK